MERIEKLSEQYPWIIDYCNHGKLTVKGMSPEGALVEAEKWESQMGPQMAELRELKVGSRSEIWEKIHNIIKEVSSNRNKNFVSYVNLLTVEGKVIGDMSYESMEDLGVDRGHWVTCPYYNESELGGDIEDKTAFVAFDVAESPKDFHKLHILVYQIIDI